MALPLDLLRMVDARIRASAQALTKTGTVVEVVDSSTVRVAFDGSSSPMPVRYVAGLYLAADTRVTVTWHGAWVVTGSYQRMPTVLAPTLLNSWVNYGSGYAPAGYYKDLSGMVHVEGMIKDGTTTSGTNLFNLPAGFRPAERMSFAAASVSVIARIDVLADGNVQAITSVSSGFLALNNVHFLARQ